MQVDIVKRLLNTELYHFIELLIGIITGNNFVNT